MIPERINRMDLAHYCSVIEQLMNQLTIEAEAWAESNEVKPNQYALQARAFPRDVAENPGQFCSLLSLEAACLVDLLDQKTMPQPDKQAQCMVASHHLNDAVQLLKPYNVNNR